MQQLLENVTPREILEKRTFEKVVLDPPDLEPGSWIGAGNTMFLPDDDTFWLTTRWKRASDRGFSWDSAVAIYRSPDGESFEPVTELHRRDLVELLDDEGVRGVEGQQLLRDPATGTFHLYLAIHREKRGWDTALVTSDHPSGPWSHAGTALPLGEVFDTQDARDAVIGYVDDRYVAIYKAASGPRLDGWEGGSGTGERSEGGRVNAALATSEDGIRWTKHGVPTLDGSKQPRNLQLYGTIFPGEGDPVFVGMESREIINGITCGDQFSAYRIDLENMNLDPVFRGRWEPLSPHERTDHPVHAYMDMEQDPVRDRLLIYVETIDPEHGDGIGIDSEVDRLLLYTVDL